MRVAYERTGLELDATGTGRAIVRLEAELRADPRVELVALGHPGRGRRTARGRVARGLAREGWWLPVGVPRAAAAAGAELLHCPVPLAPPRPGLPMVVTAHDMLGLEHPEWLGRANALQARLVLRRVLRAASLVLAPSSFSRERTIELCRLDPERVRAVPWGIDEAFTPRPRPEALLSGLGVAGPYLLTVGTLQPRKNLEAALAAFELLAPAASEHRLVVVGSRGWGDQPLLDRIARSPFAERVVLAGRVSEDELIGLYSAADCLLFPSRYEGFGFPPLEAMACGCPVVASNRTSVPEMVGEAGRLVDPDEPEAMAVAVVEILGSSDVRAELSRRGRERAARFTWRRCAEQTVEAYEAAIGSR